MVRFTILARALDGLPLIASTESSKQDEETMAEYHKQAKALLRRITPSTNPLPTKATVRSDPFCFHYIVEVGVCFLVLCEKTYPRLLAFSYLMELHREFFETLTHSDVQSAMRPYEFLRFEPFLEKTRKRYINTRTLRTSHNLAELSERLQFLQILNITDVIGKDYKISRVSDGAIDTSSMPRRPNPSNRLYTTSFAGVSFLAALVSFFQDFIPSFLNLGIVASVSELRNDPEQVAKPYSIDLVSMTSSCLGFILFLQTFLILRGRSHVHWISIFSALLAIAIAATRIFTWVQNDFPPNHSWLSIIGSQSPYIALVLITLSHLATRSRPRTQVHSD